MPVSICPDFAATCFVSWLSLQQTVLLQIYEYNSRILHRSSADEVVLWIIYLLDLAVYVYREKVFFRPVRPLTIISQLEVK